MGKIVFFETISTEYVGLIKKYLHEEFKAYFFNAEPKFIENANIKQYINSGKLIDASKIIFRYDLYRQATFLAHENVDVVFERHFSSSQTIKTLERLLDFPGILDMFKKELLLDLERMYTIHLRINEIAKTNEQAREIHFVPADDFHIHSDKTSPLDTRIQITKYVNFRMRLKKIFERLFTDDLKSPKKGLLPLFYPVYLFFKKIGGVRKSKKPEAFKVGITVARHPKGIFEMNYLTDTIFIDETELPKEQVLFIDENGSKNIEDYKKRGWNFTRLLDGRAPVSLDLLWNKIIKRFLPAWLKTIFWSFTREPFFIDIKRRILQDYILWNMFLENYEINHYVRRLLPDTHSKIHILRQHGVKTWFMYPDNTAHDYHLDWSPERKNQTCHAFMYYDAAFIYGDIIERFLKKHRNAIGDYVKTGVIYSQIARQLEEGTLDSPLPREIRNKKLPKTVIGVFDTTYADHGPVKIKDGIKFGKDILRLLEDFPDVGIVFKAMKWPEEIPYLNEIYDELKNHHRCLLFYMWDKEGISASEVIAFSDFVISCAYTSPSAEALGAKKKAIYYDVGAHEIGDKYYYNRYPNFVAHSYEELKKLTNYWLYEVTDEEFEEFLNKYVKNEIDPYLDGKALTRLRKLLME